MVFDPRLAITFAVVAEELSFTRAAEKMGVAQPWVSEQIRRLEERLRLRLLVRTSRSTELTSDGLAFLPYAQALARANEEAQRWGIEREIGNRQLRLGTVDLAIEYPERSHLIDRFLSGNADTRLHIVNGPSEDLLRQLKNGELDVVLAFTTSIDERSDLRIAVTVCRRFAGLMVPRGDPLAEAQAASLSDLAGRVVVTSPGRSDPPALRRTLHALTSHGAEVFAAPEHTRATIEHLARARRWCCIRWTSHPTVRQELGDMVLLPIAGTPLQLELALLVADTSARNPLITRICAAGRALFDEQAARLLSGPTVR